MNLLHALLFCMVSFLCVSEAESWPDFCCLKLNPVEKLRVKNIAECKVQTAGLCPFDAIIIRTQKATVCYDLKNEWVIKHVVMNESDTCVMKRQKHKNNNKKEGRGRRGGKRKRKQEKGSLN